MCESRTEYTTSLSFHQNTISSNRPTRHPIPRRPAESDNPSMCKRQDVLHHLKVFQVQNPTSPTPTLSITSISPPRQIDPFTNTTSKSHPPILRPPAKPPPQPSPRLRSSTFPGTAPRPTHPLGSFAFGKPFGPFHRVDGIPDAMCETLEEILVFGFGGGGGGCEAALS